MERVFYGRPQDAEVSIDNLNRLVVAGRKYRDKPDEELAELAERYKSSLCYKLRESFLLENPEWYYGLCYELRQRAVKARQELKNKSKTSA